MTIDDQLLLTDEELEELTPEELAEYASAITAALGRPGIPPWRHRARPEQLPPECEWDRLFLRGGRGSGKTWAASHIFGEEVMENGEPGAQFAIVAPTFGSVRDVCVEGPSGILAALGTTVEAVAGGRSRNVATYNRSIGEIRLRNGAVIFCDSAADGAYRVQGKNLSAAWADEVGLWENPETAWDESLAYALRKSWARLVATATPKANLPSRRLIRRLLEDDRVVVRRLRTVDNEANLSPAFLEKVKAEAGTRLGRQELEGELLEDVEGALWKRAWIDDHRSEGPPYPGYQTVVVGLDPSDGTAEGAEQAIVVAGFGHDRHFYVLHSEGMRTSPLEYLTRAVRVAREHGGARLVIEKNHGGRALLDVLEQAFDRAGTRIPYRIVTATSGKLTRAEPVAGHYEMGRVHHVGVHTELEEQLVSYTGAPGEKSPDRMDALVHAITDLAGLGWRQGAADMGVAVPWSDAPVEGGAVPWADAVFATGPEPLPGTSAWAHRR